MQLSTVIATALLSTGAAWAKPIHILADSVVLCEGGFVQANGACGSSRTKFTVNQEGHLPTFEYAMAQISDKPVHAKADSVILCEGGFLQANGGCGSKRVQFTVNDFGHLMTFETALTPSSDAPVHVLADSPVLCEGGFVQADGACGSKRTKFTVNTFGHVLTYEWPSSGLRSMMQKIFKQLEL